MRAVRFHAWGSTPQLDDVDLPVPAPGETLVQVEAGAVGHLDLTIASGDFQLKPSLPYIAGVEGSGVVLASGHLAPGTRVLLRGAGIGMLRNGTWAEQISVPAKAVTAIPHELPADLAATFFVPTTTAHAALNDVTQLGDEEVVIVAGAAGAVGSIVVQLAVAAGATVIGLVANSTQKPLVPAGAEAVAGTDVGRLAELAASRPASLLVDTLGGSDLSRRCRWVRPGGRAVLIGYVAGTSTTLDLPNWLLDDVALLPMNMIRRERAARAAMPALAAQLASGTLHLEVERFGLDEVADVLGRLSTGRLRGRAVLVPA